MSRDVDPKSARLFDRRTVDRNIKKGLITRKDYEKHLKSLDDVTDKGTHGGEHLGDDTESSPAPAPAASEPPPENPGSNSH